MISNKVKRNLCLALTIISASTVVGKTIQLLSYSSVEWYELVSSIVITLVWIKLYLCYRKEVKNGNIFGKVRIFR